MLTVEVDGVRIAFPDQEPVNIRGTVFVPVYGVFTHMGFTVGWNASRREATLTKDNTIVVIPADGTTFTVNGGTVTPPSPQRLINNRLMLPLRAVAEAVGATPVWDATTHTAHIHTHAAGIDYEIPEPGVDYEASEPGVEYEILEPGVDYEIPEPGVDYEATAGFVRYTSSYYGFSLYLPASWLPVSSDAYSGFWDDYDIEFFEFLGIRRGPAFLNYETGKNMNIVVDVGNTSTQEMFKDALFKFVLGELLDFTFAEIFDIYERTSDIYGMYVNENYFIMLEHHVGMHAGAYDVIFYVFQAMTEVNGIAYTFTFVAPYEYFDITLFRYILSTFTV